jgi:hypothetical protein
MNVFRRSYRVLAILTALCLSIYVVLPIVLPGAPQGWRDFLLSVGTNILVIIIVFILVESVIRQREARERDKEKQERDKYRAIALRRLRSPLSQHLRLLSDMYKASVERKPDRQITNLDDLFNEDYFEQIAHLDLGRPGPASSGIGRPAIPWFQYLDLKVGEFREDLERVADRYAGYLGADTADVVEELLHSQFVGYIRSLPTLVTSLRNPPMAKMPPWSGALNLLHPHVLREHTRLFSRLVDACNAYAPDNRKVEFRDRMWSNKSHPLIGSARVPFTGENGGQRPAE